MSFTPAELSVKEIFSGDRRYKVPNYQRDFSWGFENFDDFFDDLFKSSGITLENLDTDPKNKYFFGMILLLGDKSTPNIDLPYEVIDGQQRLTAMTLFFAAIEEMIKETSMNYDTNFSERLALRRTSKGESNPLARLVNDSLNPILPIKILNFDNYKNRGADVEPNSYEQMWLLEMFEHVKKLLSKKNIVKVMGISNDELNDALYMQTLDSLGNHLSNAMLIGIYHESKEEANKLYRNLNYRGKPLGQADLIKNEVFSMLQEEYAFETWEDIEENIYESSELLQNFIYHYMYGRYKGITKNNMFDKFLSHVHPNVDEYISFLESLKKSSEYYKIILKPNENDTIFNMGSYFKKDDNYSIKRELEFFRNIDISQYRILMITLFECRDRGMITNALFKDFIKQIALHQSIHVLVKSSSNILTSVYANTSKSLLSLSEKPKENIRLEGRKIYDTFKNSLREKLPEISRVIISDLHYSVTNGENMKAKEKKDHALIKFILHQLSAEGQSKGSNKGNDGFNFIYNASIEHIIDREVECENVSSFGNLLLLEKDIHKNVKGTAKKQEMYKASRITITKSFSHDYPDFDNEKIVERQKCLLEEYYNIVKK